jgi:hypothetical protein
MRRRLAGVTLILGFLIAMAAPASAQLKDNVEVNLYGGGSWYTGSNFEVSFPQSPTPIQGRFELDSPRLFGGARLGVYTRGHWGQEFFYSYEPTEARFSRVTAPASTLAFNIQVHKYGATGLYYFQESEERRARAFASIGLGGTLYRPTSEAQAYLRDPLRGNTPDIDSSNELVMHYGLGLKTTRAAGPVGVRFDVRGFLGATPQFGLASTSDDPNATVFPSNGFFHNAEATVGVIFYFGRR